MIEVTPHPLEIGDCSFHIYILIAHYFQFCAIPCPGLNIIFDHDDVPTRDQISHIHTRYETDINMHSIFRYDH